MRPDIGGEALGGFIQCWGGGESGYSISDYNKPPSNVNNQKAFTGTAASGKYFLQQTRHKAERIHAGPAEVGRGYYDCSTCMCLHGSWVVCMS